MISLEKKNKIRHTHNVLNAKKENNEFYFFVLTVKVNLTICEAKIAVKERNILKYY